MAAARRTPPAERGDRPGTPSLMSCSVLIVEDEATLAKNIQIFLRRHGFEATTAADGQQALSLWATLRPDLVLLYQVKIPERSDVEWKLTMTPLQIRGMRLNHASSADAQWLAAALTRASARFETRINLGEGNELIA